MNKKEAIVTRVINVLYQGAKETWYIDGVETPKDKVVEYINPTTPKEPDTSELVFKPVEQKCFFYVGYRGIVHKEPNFRAGRISDLSLVEKGNCFRTEEDAKNSAKYYLMNSEYDYWFPWSGQPKPKVLPKGLEFWDHTTDSWLKSDNTRVSHIESLVYRWKRSEQV